MPKGSPVGTTTAGTIVYAQFGKTGSGYGGYGNVVVVKDANGNLHQYSHLDSIKVKVGQKVNAGFVVGGAGSTGKSTGSHLDYEVKNSSGKNVDPTSYIMNSSKGSTSSSSSSSSFTDNSGYSNWSKYGKQPSAFNGQMQQAISKGVPFAQAKAMTELIGRESSWNPNAKNPKSTAYGYGQFLSSTRSQYAKKFPNLNYNNPVDQIVLMYQYVKDRYGSAVNALKFWDKNKWY